MLGAVVRGALVVRFVVGFGLLVRLAVGVGLLVRLTVGRGLADREGVGFAEVGAGAADVAAGLAEVGPSPSTGSLSRLASVDVLADGFLSPLPSSRAEAMPPQLHNSASPRMIAAHCLPLTGR
ncbi:hypothetical protein [Micromonospora costi]|uniref:Uncharacterized protein n=1 Tax=Micromonospora costi TaxID=1530042 RepID=A0A3B0A9Y8_9ACTN|nr:hypothetical protein [Micromonospora costi]RKN55986.1 hypothetical protein D7193_15490 [Micromonospora costi]